MWSWFYYEEQNGKNTSWPDAKQWDKVNNGFTNLIKY